MKRARLVLMSLFAFALLSGCGTVGTGGGNDATPIPTVVAESAGVIAEGRIVPRESSSMSFELAGTVAEVFVSEGDQVQPGELLATLEDTESLEASLARADRALLTAQQTLDELHEQADIERSLAEQQLADARLEWVDAHEALDETDTDAYQDDLDDAWIDVQEAEEELEEAEEELEKYQDLDEDSDDREAAEEDLEEAQEAYDEALRDYHRLKNERDQAQARANLADARLERTEQELEKREQGPDPDALALAEAQLEQASADQAAAAEALSKAELTAPYRGTIARIDIAEGEQVGPGHTVIVVATLHDFYVETTDLTEMEVVDINIGTSVEIRPDALAAEMTGTVEEIAQTYFERSGDVLYTVRISLNETDPALRWGMTVECRFPPAE